MLSWNKLSRCVVLGLVAFCATAQGAVTPIGTVETVGGDPSDDGPVLPTPGDLIVPATDFIVVGDLSQLIVDGGSLVQAGGARTTGITSNFTFDGPGTAVSLGDELIVGQGGSGTFNMSNGADLTIGNGLEQGFLGSSLTFGAQGGTGTGVIDNASVLITANADLPEVRLSVGVQGTGDLTIQNGATLTVQDLTGGLGLVGDGVTVGNAFGGFAGDGSLTIQDTGTQLTIDTIDVAGLIVGVSADGIDSAVGVVDILNGADVFVRGTGGNSGINVGRGGNSDGTLNVAGSGTTLDVIGPQGIIAIASNFGGEPGATNALMTVTDNALVTLAGLTPEQGFLSVGNGAGTGVLNVNTGGRIDIDGWLRISVANQNGNSQTGTVNVTDTGVINVNTIQIGNRGTLFGDGTVTADVLTVQTGGTLDLDDISGIGEINLTGGTYDAPVGAFNIGRTGGQIFSITNGGQFTAPGPVLIDDATVLIDGPGSTFASADDITANSQIALNNGAVFESASAITIASGGSLIGDGGIIRAPTVTIDTGGLVAPGNSPGTLNIEGDFTFDGGIFELEIAGIGAGEFDVLNVDGDASFLDGIVTISLLNGFNPGGNSFDFVTSTGTLTIAPNVDFMFNGLGPDFEVSTRLQNGLDIGTLTFTARDVGLIPGLNAQQSSMALYLDQLCPLVETLSSPDANAIDLDLRCGNLRSGSTSDAQVSVALAQLTPDEVMSSFSGLAKILPFQHGTLARRLNGLRSGASRIDVSNLNIATENVQISGEDLQNTLEELAQSNFERWGFFSSGYVSYGDRDSNEHAPGYEFNSAAFTVGTDYKLRENLYLGVAFGYNETDADFDVGGGIQTQAYSLSLLGTYFRGDSFYVDALATYAISDVETDRRILYSDFTGPINRRAEGDSDGEQWAAGIGSGFDFTRGRWVWGPHVGLNYSESLIDSFDEEGAGGLNLAFADIGNRSLAGNVGAHFSYTMTPSWGVVVPYAQVDYVHEYKYASETERVRFVADNFSATPISPIQVETGSIDANYVSWSLGLHFQLIRGIAGFIDYRGTEGLREYDRQEFALGIRFERRKP